MGGMRRSLAAFALAGLAGIALAQDAACTPDVMAAAPTDSPAQVRDTATPAPPEVVAGIRERGRLEAFHALLPAAPDAQLRMPVAGVGVAQVVDTWGAARSGGRIHEGQDIFAPLGTPVYSATEGYVYRIGPRERGGLTVWVAGAGGRRYYYAHLQDWADIEVGMYVTTDTVLGYVGNTGNAAGTPPHLHFGVYSGSRRTCDRKVHDPLPLLVDR